MPVQPLTTNNAIRISGLIPTVVSYDATNKPVYRKISDSPQTPVALQPEISQVVSPSTSNPATPSSGAVTAAAKQDQNYQKGLAAYNSLTKLIDTANSSNTSGDYWKAYSYLSNNQAVLSNVMNQSDIISLMGKLGQTAGNIESTNLTLSQVTNELSKGHLVNARNIAQGNQSILEQTLGKTQAQSYISQLAQAAEDDRVSGLALYKINNAVNIGDYDTALKTAQANISVLNKTVGTTQMSGYLSQLKTAKTQSASQPATPQPATPITGIKPTPESELPISTAIKSVTEPTAAALNSLLAPTNQIVAGAKKIGGNGILGEALADIGEFGEGVYRAVVPGTVQFIGQGAAAIENAAHNPGIEIPETIAGGAALATQIKEEAETNPFGFAGSLAGMVIAGKVIDEGFGMAARSPVGVKAGEIISEKVTTPLKTAVSEELALKKEQFAPITTPIQKNVIEPVKTAIQEKVVEPLNEGIIKPINKGVISPIKEGIENEFSLKQEQFQPVTKSINKNIITPLKEGIANEVSLKQEQFQPVIKSINKNIINPIKEGIANEISLKQEQFRPINKNIINPLKNEVNEDIIKPIQQFSTKQAIKSIGKASDQVVGKLRNFTFEDQEYGLEGPQFPSKGSIKDLQNRGIAFAKENIKASASRAFQQQEDLASYLSIIRDNSAKELVDKGLDPTSDDFAKQLNAKVKIEQNRLKNLHPIKQNDVIRNVLNAQARANEFASPEFKPIKFSQEDIKASASRAFQQQEDLASYLSIIRDNSAKELVDKGLDPTSPEFVKQLNAEVKIEQNRLKNLHPIKQNDVIRNVLNAQARANEFASPEFKPIKFSQEDIKASASRAFQQQEDLASYLSIIRDNSAKELVDKGLDPTSPEFVKQLNAEVKIEQNRLKNLHPIKQNDIIQQAISQKQIDEFAPPEFKPMRGSLKDLQNRGIVFSQEEITPSQRLAFEAKEAEANNLATQMERTRVTETKLPAYLKKFRTGLEDEVRSVGGDPTSVEYARQIGAGVKTEEIRLKKMSVSDRVQEISKSLNINEFAPPEYVKKFKPMRGSLKDLQNRGIAFSQEEITPSQRLAFAAKEAEANNLATQMERTRAAESRLPDYLAQYRTSVEAELRAAGKDPMSAEYARQIGADVKSEELRLKKMSAARRTELIRTTLNIKEPNEFAPPEFKPMRGSLKDLQNRGIAFSQEEITPSQRLAFEAKEAEAEARAKELVDKGLDPTSPEFVKQLNAEVKIEQNRLKNPHPIKQNDIIQQAISQKQIDEFAPPEFKPVKGSLKDLQKIKASASRAFQQQEDLASYLSIIRDNSAKELVDKGLDPTSPEFVKQLNAEVKIEQNRLKNLHPIKQNDIIQQAISQKQIDEFAPPEFKPVKGSLKDLQNRGIAFSQEKITPSQRLAFAAKEVEAEARAKEFETGWDISKRAKSTEPLLKQALSERKDTLEFKSPDKSPEKPSPKLTEPLLKQALSERKDTLEFKSPDKSPEKPSPKLTEPLLKQALSERKDTLEFKSPDKSPEKPSPKLTEPLLKQALSERKDTLEFKSPEKPSPKLTEPLLKQALSERKDTLEFKSPEKPSPKLTEKSKETFKSNLKARWSTREKEYSTSESGKGTSGRSGQKLLQKIKQEPKIEPKVESKLTPKQKPVQKIEPKVESKLTPKQKPVQKTEPAYTSPKFYNVKDYDAYGVELEVTHAHPAPLSKLKVVPSLTLSQKSKPAPSSEFAPVSNVPDIGNLLKSKIGQNQPHLLNVKQGTPQITGVKQKPEQISKLKSDQEFRLESRVKQRQDNVQRSAQKPKQKQEPKLKPLQETVPRPKQKTTVKQKSPAIPQAPKSALLLPIWTLEEKKPAKRSIKLGHKVSIEFAPVELPFTISGSGNAYKKQQKQTKQQRSDEYGI